MAIYYLSPDNDEREWDFAWGQLRVFCQSLPSDIDEEHPLNGERWQHMGVESKCGFLYHSFRHRDRARSRRILAAGRGPHIGRVYLWITASERYHREHGHAEPSDPGTLASYAIHRYGELSDAAEVFDRVTRCEEGNQ